MITQIISRVNIEKSIFLRYYYIKRSKDMGQRVTKDMMEGIIEHKYLFHCGNNYRSYELFGAHRMDGGGYLFRVWAPRAVAISLVGDFNNWDIEADPFIKLEDDETIWEARCPSAKEGDLYKFAVKTDKGEIHYKADPFAFGSETEGPGSQRASRIYDISKEYPWSDEEWIIAAAKRNPYKSAMNIYEVHLGSWRRKEDGSLYTYEELAEILVPYVKDMGYTHIELLPVMEHPFDGSWGYQITGYYSATSRYGTPDGLKKLIDTAHNNGIGVILDWVPAHFPKDEHGLADFDGYHLYEYSDPLKMEHKGWGTRSFDLGRPEVQSFLVSNAFFYCEQFHVDGLRVDAVAAMLYLNYDRPDGEWRPNDEGGTENKEAISFFQMLNKNVLTNFPNVLMIAEESTAWPNVTKPPEVGGLGFNFKWNMGWMNDTLEYYKTDPLFRGGVHNKLTFAMTYAYSENFILPISHDEVVHGKRSLLDKMPGEYDDKFAGMRAFLVFMMTHPGKKLLFMGQELGHFAEWDEKKELDWMLLDFEQHAQMQEFVSEINNYYKNTEALWKLDDSFEGFCWIDADNSDDSVYTYYRTGGNGDVALVALNLSGRDFEEYDIGVPSAEAYECVIDTLNDKYRKGEIYKPLKGECNGYEQHVTIPLPKLSAVILEKR